MANKQQILYPGEHAPWRFRQSNILLTPCLRANTRGYARTMCQGMQQMLKVLETLYEAVQRCLQKSAHHLFSAFFQLGLVRFAAIWCWLAVLLGKTQLFRSCPIDLQWDQSWDSSHMQLWPRAALQHPVAWQIGKCAANTPIISILPKLRNSQLFLPWKMPKLHANRWSWLRKWSKVWELSYGRSWIPHPHKICRPVFRAHKTEGCQMPRAYKTCGFELTTTKQTHQKGSL